MTLQEFFNTGYFKSLVFEANCYRALERGGVDNWSWYGYSYSDYCDEHDTDSIDEVADQEIRTAKAVYQDD